MLKTLPARTLGLGSLVAVTLLTLGLTIGAARAQGLPTAHPPLPRPDPAATEAGRLAVEEVYEVGPTVYVRALALEPARQALWVGTSAGVHEVDLVQGQVRQTFTREQGLASEYVFAIHVDRQGRKWFGTNAGGVSRYQEDGTPAAVASAGKAPPAKAARTNAAKPVTAKPGAEGTRPAWTDPRWAVYFPQHGLADYWVYAFAEQAGGDLWIGTWAGANKVDAKTGRFSTYVKELVNEWVYGIAIDAQDRVWFGTEGGVTRHDPRASDPARRWTSWTHADGLGAPNVDGLPASPNTGLGTRQRHDLSVRAAGRSTYNPSYVFSMLAARDGSIWAGTWGGGAAHFDGQRWRNLTRADGLAGNIVYALAQDTSGAIWFGTDQGVSRWDGARGWARVGRAQGLVDDHVYTLAVQADGSVWAGTRGGVARLRWQAATAALTPAAAPAPGASQ